MNVILKAGREKSLLRRHPWIFSGAIQQADSNTASGATVDLLSSDQQFLARTGAVLQSRRLRSSRKAGLGSRDDGNGARQSFVL